MSAADDFDMAKLQKALKQDQRKSLMSKNKVAKLTPAEIRSLNHSVGLSKNSSVRSLDSQSSRRLASTTPPLTPDNHSTSRRSHSQRRASVEPPTPPLSPDRERRGSASSARHIHAPKPLSHAQALHLASGPGHSRPSSQSSYRGVPTYRGNEITRNNSLTMFQHPSQQIVSNPLSQFSRPRQSILASSTSQSHKSLDQPVAEAVVGSANMKDRPQSFGAMAQTVAREHSPIRPSDSPVSMEDGEVSERKVEKQPEFSESVPVVHVTPQVVDSSKDEPTEPSAKQRLSWRRTLTSGSSDTDADVVRLRKEYRRRTLLSPKNGYCLHAIHYDDTKPGHPPLLRDSLRGELPSTKTSVFKEAEKNQAAEGTEYGQHPAVRPLSQDARRSLANESESSESSSSPPSNKKGKQRELDSPDAVDSDASSLASSVPSYMRCSCCGRIQKPGGFESELSPVLENENLRTNFSLEAEKMSTDRRRRSSSAAADGTRRYIPIIPMAVGNETKQARIEPVKGWTPQVAPQAPALRGATINKPGDIIGPSSTPLAIMPRRKIDPALVRFASLHRTKDDNLEEQGPPKPAEPMQNLAPAPQIQRFSSLYGLRNESQRQAQYLEHEQDQSASRTQQNPQSAYQAQQTRPRLRSSRKHPLRMSHNAVDDDDDDDDAVLANKDHPGLYRTSTPVETMAIEKPLGDSPASRRVEDPISSQSAFLDDDSGAGIDLSSFDGSFVHGSISRSATLLHEPSPTNQMYDSNITFPTTVKSNAGATAASTLSLPARLDTSSNPSMSGSSVYSAPPTSYPSAFNPDHPPRLDTNLSGSIADPTSHHKLFPSTALKFVESNPTSLSGSPTSAKGPPKIGDWVLPESSMTPSIKTPSVHSESISVKRGATIA